MLQNSRVSWVITRNPTGGGDKITPPPHTQIRVKSILGISKTLIHEFWYDYIKPKYQDREKVCYMDTDSFLIHTETKDVYKDIANGV